MVCMIVSLLPGFGGGRRGTVEIELLFQGLPQVGVLLFELFAQPGQKAGVLPFQPFVGPLDLLLEPGPQRVAVVVLRVQIDDLDVLPQGAFRNQRNRR